jgi:oxygen-independent coproporphyrinogen-3 oxidase
MTWNDTDAHNSANVVRASKYFDNISIDLIYGVPGWQMKVATQHWKALSFGIPFSYALTVEPKTTLKKKLIQRKSGWAKRQVLRTFCILVIHLLQMVFAGMSNLGKKLFFEE